MGESWSSYAPLVEENERVWFRWFWRECEVVVRGWGFVVIVVEAIGVNLGTEAPWDGEGIASPESIEDEEMRDIDAVAVEDRLFFAQGNVDKETDCFGPARRGTCRSRARVKWF